MADDCMAFIERIKQQLGGDFLHSLVGAVLSELMNYEASNQIGANSHEHNDDRRTYRYD